MECWSKEIQSKAPIALAWQLNLSKVIQLLLLRLQGPLTLCGPPLPSLPAPKSRSDVVSAPSGRAARTSSTAPNGRCPAASRPQLSVVMALTHGAGGTTGCGCSWRKELCHQTSCSCCGSPVLGTRVPQTRQVELSSPCTIDFGSSVLQVDLSYIGIFIGIKILLGLKMAGLSTKQQNNLHLFLSYTYLPYANQCKPAGALVRTAPA